MHPLQFVVRIGAEAGSFPNTTTKTTSTVATSRPESGSTIGVPYVQRKVEYEAENDYPKMK